MSKKKKTSKKSAAKKAGAKKSAKKAGKAKSTEQLRKEAIASIDQRLGGAKKRKPEAAGVPRVDGEALADTARANRRKAAATGNPKTTAAGKKATKNAKAATGERRERRAKTARPPSGLDLAAKVLADAKEPLAAKTIAERAIAAGWTTNGKTPHATLYSAIIREIADKGSESRFKKTDRGLFTSVSGGGKGA